MRTGRLCIRNVVTATRDEPVSAVAARMLEHHVGAIVVVDHEAGAARPIGICTDRDLLVALARADLQSPRTLPVGEVMSADLLVSVEDEDLFDAVARMRRRGVRRIPVVDRHGALAGILTADDVVDVLASELDQLRHIEPHAERNEARLRRGGGD